MQVLIADDEPTSRILLEESLIDWGYEVFAASDGNEAWDIVQRADGPRLVILDWMMPGMDGPELCRKMREALNSQYVYIVLLTSKNQKQDVILGMDAGADAFLTKPVDLGELRSRLAAARRILEHQSVLIKARNSETMLKSPPAMTTPVFPPVPSLETIDLPDRLRRVTRDLSHDGLLAALPRIAVGEQNAPVLSRMPILCKLGEGGMGAVYRAYNPRLKTDVAVKVLSNTVFKQRTDAAARFYREAEIAASIRSPHLVAVMDIEQEHGLLFLVMEFVDGKSATASLSTALAEGQAGLREEDALLLCLAVAKGLAAAHAHGVVHRDVKPDNILVPWDAKRTGLMWSAAKLADLGIARVEVSDSSLTSSNSSLGTAGYMSPEQIRDAKRAGRPSDVFSLGATLYSLLCGHAPFKGTSLFDVCMDTINNQPHPIGQYRTGLGPSTLEVLGICLAKEPEHRYPDGQSLVKGLEQALELLRRTPSKNVPTASSPRLDGMGLPMDQAPTRSDQRDTRTFKLPDRDL